VVTEAGLVDYFDQQEYDRSWIYRGIRDGVIVDVIWDMANHRAPVDEAWLTRGSEIDIHGTRISLVAPEELIWAKLYIVQRDRCDWPDLMNIIDAQGQRLDWGHLLRRAGEDVLLLGAMMSLFGWLCPVRARELPAWIWSRMGIAVAEAGPSCHDDPRRVALLDTREWFGRTSGGA
jgi:hypothetical protein